MVTTQIGNLLAHRTERVSFRQRGLRGNRLIWVGVASELVLIVAFVYLDPLAAVIGTGPFAAWLWVPLLALSPLLLLVDEVRKGLRARRTRSAARRARDRKGRP